MKQTNSPATLTGNRTAIILHKTYRNNGVNRSFSVFVGNRQLSNSMTILADYYV